MRRKQYWRTKVKQGIPGIIENVVPEYFQLPEREPQNRKTGIQFNKKKNQGR